MYRLVRWGWSHGYTLSESSWLGSRTPFGVFHLKYCHLLPNGLPHHYEKKTHVSENSEKISKGLSGEGKEE